MNYDEAMDYERYAWDDREENVSDTVYIICDKHCILTARNYYNLKEAQRQFDAIMPSDGEIYLGEIDENDIDPMDWAATMRLMNVIDKR